MTVSPPHVCNWSAGRYSHSYLVPSFLRVSSLYCSKDLYPSLLSPVPVMATNLNKIVTRSELAETLDTPVPALGVATLSNRCRRNAGCSLFAVHHNFGYVAHSLLIDMVYSSFLLIVVSVVQFLQNYTEMASQRLATALL